MTSKRTLPSVRISEDCYSNIERAVKKYNEKALAPLTLQEFRRLSYAMLAKMILLDYNIPIELKS
jgi:hypothetical protein